MNIRHEFIWVDPKIIPDAAHLLQFFKVYAIANDNDEVLVYTGRPNTPQCNRSKKLVEMRLETYRDKGATKVIYIDRMFVVDSPNNYF